MSRQIFSVFFLLFFVCCQLCVEGHTVESEETPNDTDGKLIDEFLKPEDTKIKEKLKSPEERDASKINVEHIESVSLVAANGVVFALAEVNYTDNTGTKERKIDVLAKYFEAKQDKWGDEAFKKAGKWDVKSVTEKVTKTNKNAVIKSFAAATKDNKIYHITICNCISQQEISPVHPPPAAASEEWHIKVVKGEVTNGSGSKEINLESSIISKFTYKPELEEKLDTKPEKLPPSDGFVFVIDDNNIFFFMKGKTNDKGGKKNIIAVFELNVKGEGKLELLPHNFPVECYPLFFQWEEEVIMAPSTCSHGSSHNVKAFNKTTKKTFDDTDKPIARLRDFLKDKNIFSTATIGNISVLFCTQQKNNIKEDTKKNVYLWMTDGTRVSNVGTIVEDIAADSTFDGSVLYTKEELIALHQKYNNAGDGEGEKVANTFSLRRLKDQLDNITYTLNVWKESNETVSELCKKTKTSNIKCNTSPPTYGLVSFLHNTLIEGGDIVWKDKYYFSNVTIAKTKAENLPNGLTFGGKGAGTKWPLSKQNEKPYNFIYFGFTLVATVTITNNTSNNKNSILGVSLTPTTNNNVGLWCNTDGKWGVSDGGDSTFKKSDKECKHGNTYNVALVLKTQNLNIYINGEKLTNDIKINELSKNIEHFYFGANDVGDVESHVTVRNVLLYNRPFDAGEIENLKNYVKSVKVTTPPNKNIQEESKDNTAGVSDKKTSPPKQPSPTEEEKEEKSPSPSRTEDGGVGGGVRVFCLLLAVLCVSAPLLHL